ncbi:hypothetical protein Ptc2401_00955 [Prosthecochloris sp. CIB 2401]|nr:hypothetical protein Ptc2401_00955 [Prosthecochloris sp. CIB 2401]
MLDAMRKKLPVSVLLRGMFLCVAALLLAAPGNMIAQSHEGQPEKVTFQVITPPDPNFIPMSVLTAKAAEFMPGVGVEMVMAPSGDPSAMRAMLYSKSADFALFSVLGGSRFYAAGLTDLSLVGVHVWKGVHLVARESVTDVRQLDGERVIAVPAIMTPSHMVSTFALQKMGVRPDYVSGGGGPVLMAQLSRPENAPMAFVAPEPMVSIILNRQESEGWPVRYRVLMDSQAAASPETGETPLGGLWVVNSERVGSRSEAAREFVEGFRKAIAYVNDPANREEVSVIVSQAMKDVYRQGAPVDVYKAMLQSGRLRLDFRGADVTGDVIVSELKKIYDVTIDRNLLNPVF